MKSSDIIIAGAGIVGLATALKLKERYPDKSITIIEKEFGVAKHQTGHNSGVIHSGLYYKPGSLKALNCVNGYEQLVRFCETHEVPFEICGKIVVATRAEQLPQLEMLKERGMANGLKGIKSLKAAELKEYEPHVAGLGGLWVPQTGIVDYKVVAEKYADLFIKMGGRIDYGSPIIDIRISETYLTVITSDKTYECGLLINCAGLYSDRIAALTHKKLNVRIVPFRGEYYKLRPDREHLVKNLIYPVPDPNFPFLGVHFTRMIGGGIEAGPNAVLAFRREGYKKSQIHLGELGATFMWPGFRKVAGKYWKTGMGEMYRSFSKSAFTKALQELIPEIRKEDLIAGGAGVRAQACDKNGGLLDDFYILQEERLIHVLNAPSPAATSSLAIGSEIAGRV